MLMMTKVTFNGCQVWIDGENKRELAKTSGLFERWVLNQIGDPPKFSLAKQPPNGINHRHEQKQKQKHKEENKDNDNA